MDNRKLIIVGASALGRETCNYARESGQFDVVGFLDDRPSVLDGFVGYPPLLGAPADCPVRDDAWYVCAVGSGSARERFVESISAHGGRFASVIHPSAYVGPNARLGVGCIVCPWAYLDCDVRLGDHVVANVRSFVAHDCFVDDFATLSPCANVAGRCHVGKRVFLGIGANCRPDVTLADDAVVGAGAAVVRNVDAGVTVAGCPARPIRIKEDSHEGPG